MLDALQPSALVFSKLDVWPNLVRGAHARGVPTALLSATMASGSGRQGGFARALLHDAYAALDSVGAIDAENAKRLEQLGVSKDRLQVSGDTRFDQVWARAQNVDRTSALLRALHSARPTLVAGSTWPADEAVLLPAWLDLKAKVPNARLIIAPHEPTAAHLNPIQSWARAHTLTIKLLSEVSPSAADDRLSNSNAAAQSTITTLNTTDADVILIDRIGVLGDIYAVADAAFVGGAFHKAGLHSVIEPAAFGRPVVFGPSYGMSREAGLLLQHRGASSVSSAAQCTAALVSYLADAAERQRAGAAAKALVQSELGAAGRSLQLVLRLLERP